MGFVMTGGVSAKDRYPERAANDEISGMAVIDCVLQVDGKVKDCVVVKEAPQGYGFGEATVKLFEDEYNINSQKPSSQKPSSTPHKPGDHMTFTYKWIID
jgi:protein TonB